MYHRVLLLLLCHRAAELFCYAASVSSYSTRFVQSLSAESIPSHNSRSVSSNSNSCVIDDANERWCYCGQDDSYDKMIACEHPGCEIEWFHYSCVRFN